MLNIFVYVYLEISVYVPQKPGSFVQSTRLALFVNTVWIDAKIKEQTHYFAVTAKSCFYHSWRISGHALLTVHQTGDKIWWREVLYYWRKSLSTNFLTCQKISRFWQWCHNREKLKIISIVFTLVKLMVFLAEISHYEL